MHPPSSARRKLIFLAGDIRREKCPFGFAWGKYEHFIDYEEAARAVTYGMPGYIGLHRNRGDLSNVAIKGFMKHAWLHVGSHKIVEAVSEGVLLRHSFHALMSDYAVILQPYVTYSALTDAVKRAANLVGTPYDDHFNFDLEIEDQMFADKETALGNMKEYGLGVSCTEAVALAFVGHRRKLGLFRIKQGHREVIMPDNYLTTHFKVVWASKETTAENAKKLGLHEEGCCMLNEYWDKIENRR